MKPTLLIADADPELCDVYEMFLSEYGYDVETASDGLDCVEKLRRVTPAGLVLDLDLLWGGSDGVLAWLRENDPTHTIPVILIATVGDPRDWSAFLEPPVVDCLFKPFASTELLESLRSVVAMNGRRESFDSPRRPAHS